MRKKKYNPNISSINKNADANSNMHFDFTILVFSLWLILFIHTLLSLFIGHHTLLLASYFII